MSVPAKKANWIPTSKPSTAPVRPATEPLERRGAKWGFGSLFGVFLIVQLGLMEYWSIEPDQFDIVEAAVQSAQVSDAEELPTGYIFTNTLVQIAETLLTKKGGYLTNDMTPPSILMDNMPSWEFGALVMLRDASTALRNHFARSQSQSSENTDLARAEPSFYFQNDSWMIPPTENEYEKGQKLLINYMADLRDKKPRASFYSRADNLSQYLQIVEKRLGSLSHRLSASSATQHRTVHLIDRASAVSTPWLEVDDVFFEARGAMWALLHIFRAIEVDFKATLGNKAGMATVRRIIEELEDSQGTLLSPVVLNGNGFGIFANYSLTMGNYITRANAATLDLRDLMIRG